MDTEHVESKIPVIHRDYLPSRKDLDVVIKDFTSLKVESFGNFIKEMQHNLEKPREEVEKHSAAVKHRINEHTRKMFDDIHSYKERIFQYIHGYEQTSFSKLEAISSKIEDIKKLIRKCEDKYNEWTKFINKKDYENYQLMKIVLEAIELRRELHETHETLLFSTQKLYSLENNLYTYLQSKELNNIDLFYLDMGRIKNVKSGKTSKLDTYKTTNCKIFPTYGSHVIVAWSEYGMYKLQLLDLNCNSETLNVVKTVTNSASDDAFIDGANDGTLIAFMFTYDGKSYWLKAYDSTLKETGIIKLNYAPISMRVHENYIYVFSNQTPLIRVYNSNLEEVQLNNKNVEPIVYYLLKYGQDVVFRNDYAFVLSPSSKLDIIHRDSDQILQSLDLENVKFFQVDSLLRLILYKEDVKKLVICDLNNNTVHELNAPNPLTHFCSTDNGYLIATNGQDGEVYLF